MKALFQKLDPVRRSIAFKCLSMTVLLLVLFAVIVCYIGYKGFTEALTAQYTDSAYRLANAAAAYVSPDRLEGYLVTGGNGDDYKASWERLDKLCNGADVTFIYVIRPNTDDYRHITFVFSTVNHNTSYTPYEIGFVRPTTNQEYRDKYRALYEGTLDEATVVLEGSGYARSGYHLTAMIPLRGADGRTDGILCVQRPTEELSRVRLNYVHNILGVVFILTVIVLFWQGAALGRVLLRPIKTVTEEASRFARENTLAEHKLTETIRNRDEIGVLAESIDTMEEQVQRYVEDLTKITAEKERIGTELRMAARIQNAMMPSDFPNRDEFSLYAAWAPALGVGGDFYDFFLIDDDHLCMVIADVSGKGIPGALFMMISKVILQSCAMLGKSAGEILTKTNEALCSNNKSMMFVTVWLGILEISTGKLQAANAGHEYPAVCEPDGSFTLFKDPHGFVIGGMEGVRYREYELRLKPGSRLFLYTDGVPEATDSDGKMFGTDRMLDALNRDAQAGPEALVGNVIGAVADFVGDAEPFDDLTMLTLAYRGPGGEGKQR